MEALMRAQFACLDRNYAEDSNRMGGTREGRLAERVASKSRSEEPGVKGHSPTRRDSSHSELISTASLI